MRASGTRRKHVARVGIRHAVYHQAALRARRLPLVSCNEAQGLHRSSAAISVARRASRTRTFC